MNKITTPTKPRISLYEVQTLLDAGAYAEAAAKAQTLAEYHREMEAIALEAAARAELRIAIGRNAEAKRAHIASLDDDDANEFVVIDGEMMRVF